MAKEETTSGVLHRVIHSLFREVHLQNKIHPKILYLCRLIMLSGRSFVLDLCPQRAAALAYTTILSLVPVTALFVLYFKMAGKLDSLSETIQQWILNTFVAEAAQNVSVYIDQFVGNIHTRALGTLGVGGLVVSAYMTFRTIERSINDIWKIRKHRSILARFQILSSVLIVVPALMVASIYFSGKFQELKFLSQNQVLTTYTRTLFVALPFFFTFLTFFMIFKWIPNTKVLALPAFIATTISTIMFEAAKTGFNLYVVHVISVNKIYGALGLIPVLLIWIFLSWLIILIGVEITYAIQNYDLLYEETLERLRVDPLDVPIHEEWGLKVMKSLESHFRKGMGSVHAEAIATDLGIRASHVLNHLEVLIDGNIVTEVEKEGDISYLFTRPLDSISDADVINLFRTRLKLPVKSF